MMNRKVVPFFCDECGVELSTSQVCVECKRVLCHVHYFGSPMRLLRRKDGLCVKCAETRAKVIHEEAEQT